MYKIDPFTIWAGLDVPFGDTGFNMHQPKLIEIAQMGESIFFNTLNLLLLTRDNFPEDADIKEEDLFLCMYSSAQSQEDIQMSVINFLLMIFPNFNFGAFYEYNIVLTEDLNNLQEKVLVINRHNFKLLQSMLTELFYLEGEKTNEYNPSNDAAKAIAEKLKRGRKVAERERGASEENKNFLIKYCSVLSIGLKVSVDDILTTYTLPLLKDSIERLRLNINFDVGIQFKAAGSKEDLEDWEKRLI